MAVAPPAILPPSPTAKRLAQVEFRPKPQLPQAVAVTKRRSLRILILSGYGDVAIALAHRLVRDGHKPELYILHDEYRESGKGIVPRIEDLPGNYSTYDLLVVTYKNFGRIVEECGIPVVGPNRAAEKLENDRKFGMEILEKNGIRCPPWKFFTDKETALAWVKTKGGRFVLKPNGTEAPKLLTYCAKMDDSRDLISILEYAEEAYPEILKEGFILQEFIPGIEIAAGTYFDGHDFVQPVMVNFENKSFGMKPFPGPPTGEMGSHGIYLKDPKLFQEATVKMGSYLKKINYHGDFDINYILAKDGPYALEMTPRTGYPTLCLQMAAMDSEDYGDILYRVATGTSKPIKVAKPWAVGVMFTSMPFPYEDECKNLHDYAGWEIHGPLLTDHNLFPLNVEKKDKKVITTGIGSLAVACGVGATLKEAKTEAYLHLEKLHVPYAYARPDIGDRFLEEEAELKQRGYLS
jgi:phosphoribosylamine--glycine ligase